MRTSVGMAACAVILMVFISLSAGRKGSGARGRRFSRRLLLQAIAGYGAAAVLFVVFLRNANWTTLVAGARSAAWPMLAVAVALRLASLVVASLRWQALLQPAANAPLADVVAITMMGMTASTVAPMPAAEFVRPYALSRRQGVEFGTVLATATAEWFLDACVVVALFIAALMVYHAGHAAARIRMAAPVSVLCVGVGGVAMLKVLPRRAAPWADRILARSGSSACARVRTAAWCRSFAAGLRALDASPRLVVIVGYSVLSSTLTALSAWSTLNAFDLSLSVSAGFLLLGLITLAGMVPTPGAIGGFHSVCQVGLVTLFGLDPAHTVLPVIALHGVLYLPGAALGAIFFLMWPARLHRSRA